MFKLHFSISKVTPDELDLLFLQDFKASLISVIVNGLSNSGLFIVAHCS